MSFFFAQKLCVFFYIFLFFLLLCCDFLNIHVLLQLYMLTNSGCDNNCKESDKWGRIVVYSHVTESILTIVKQNFLHICQKYIFIFGSEYYCIALCLTYYNVQKFKYGSMFKKKDYLFLMPLNWCYLKQQKRLP